jgi:FMN phosphatase YigB (HAD superfamily)
MSKSTPWNLILDFRDMLLNHCPDVLSLYIRLDGTDIDASNLFLRYNDSKLKEDEFCLHLANRLSLDASRVIGILEQARETAKVNHEMQKYIEDLRIRHAGHLRVSAMSNLSQPEWKFIRAVCDNHTELFDDIFLSSDTGMCKPELRFFRHVLKTTKTLPERAILVDSNNENLLAARALGMRGMLFSGIAELRRQLRIILEDPVQRGMKYLIHNAKMLHSFTSNGIIVSENFSQLLIYEAIGLM